MKKIDVHQLWKRIPNEEFDYCILTSVLSGYVGVRQKINALLKSGVIVRVKKGLYVFGADYGRAPISRETLANLIYGPSYISLEYALAHYGLIPERVEIVTSVTPKRDKEFDTPLGRFSYRYLAMEKYSQGIEQVWLDRNHAVLMASPEKALCDYLTLKKTPALGNADEAREFLEDDLRISRENFKRLNWRVLRKLSLNLSKSGKNKNIEWVQEAIAEVA